MFKKAAKTSLLEAPEQRLSINDDTSMQSMIPQSSNLSENDIKRLNKRRGSRDSINSIASTRSQRSVSRRSISRYLSSVDSQIPPDGQKTRYFWALSRFWQCLCVSCCLIQILFLMIIIPAFIFKIAPHIAQKTLDNATMSIINATIYNPTNTSITMNTTMLISNAGFLNAEIHSSTVTVTNNNIKMGEMTLPSLKTVANQNTIIEISSVLHVTNITQFQKSCRELLQNVKQIWRISARNVVIRVDTGIIGDVHYSVDIRKELILKGTNLHNFVSSDFNVNSATNNTLSTSSNLNYISKSTFTFILPNTLLSIYYNDVYIGYVPLSGLTMKPGLNIISNQSLVIEAYPHLNNRDELNEFFSNYVSGKRQNVVMKGPKASKTKGYPITVIHDILCETIVALGYDDGPLAFGGLVTSQSETGWKVDTKTVRGAYGNFINPLNVPIKIVNMTAIAYMQEPIQYHVNLIKWAVEYECNASVFAELSIGPGIYQNDSHKTWVDVNANERVTYFNIASPPKSSKKESCLDIYDFSCCFATLTAAYVCKLNPYIQKHPAHGELSIDYMPLKLNANITMLIDNKFKIETLYSQSLFPLYFGYDVYGGYMSDLEISCKSFEFK